MKVLLSVSLSWLLLIVLLPQRSTDLKAVSLKKRTVLSCGPSALPGEKFYDGVSALADLRKLYVPDLENAESYNTLFIPDTLAGPNITLRIHDSILQCFTGAPTSTVSFNSCPILGPTLVLQQGKTVHIHVKNLLNDTTTIHWHGMHLPAIMDGGPHQPIAPATTWSPSWKVTNNAATYWYHPHLHMKTTEQIVKGLAGMIIIHDAAEAALALPRTYGVDDIPLILNDKRFDGGTNQFIISHYGDTMMCNGTLHAKYNVPAQVVRFRVLDAAQERSYNIGFSDGRKFFVIASDDGLLDKPVEVKRYTVSAGERIEILVDFNGQENQQVTLRAFNSKLDTDIPGGEPDNTSTRKELRNDLGARDFDILRLSVTGQTKNAVTQIPSSLVRTGRLDTTDASVTRVITMTNEGTSCSLPSYGCYSFNGRSFDMNRVDYRPRLNATEIWQITNNTNTSHPFHIHDVSFKILDKTNEPVPEYEKGWKDVVLVRKGSTVRFIARFDDYADSVHPYMYHCHITLHEDAGMMGQFVVMPLPSVNIANAKTKEGDNGTKIIDFPVTLNTASDQTVTVQYKTKDGTAVSPSDYLTASGTLTFNPGETAKTISIQVNGDTSPEADETFKVVLSQPHSATVDDRAGKGTIKDDDGLAATGSTVGASSVKPAATLFPNPVKNLLHLTGLPEDVQHLVSILDMNGRLLMRKTISGPSGEISVDGLSPGSYYVSIESAGGNTTLRFIKE